jgi:hypothetical protein
MRERDGRELSSLDLLGAEEKAAGVQRATTPRSGGLNGEQSCRMRRVRGAISRAWVFIFSSRRNRGTRRSGRVLAFARGVGERPFTARASRARDETGWARETWCVPRRGRITPGRKLLVRPTAISAVKLLVAGPRSENDLVGCTKANLLGVRLARRPKKTNLVTIQICPHSTNRFTCARPKWPECRGSLYINCWTQTGNHHRDTEH